MNKIAILACDALKDEIEQLTHGDPVFVSREYLDFGLHLTPEELKKVILEKLAGLEGTADVVFLGFGYCQSLQGLPSQVGIPVVMLEYEDCIAALLTTERYHGEKHNGGITWFYPSGWARSGPDGLTKLFHLDCARSEGYEPEYFLKIMFDGFNRCLFVDTGAGDIGKCEEHSKELARRLGLVHDRTVGSLDLVKEAIDRAKAMAEGIEAGPEPSP